MIYSFNSSCWAVWNSHTDRLMLQLLHLANSLTWLLSLEVASTSTGRIAPACNHRPLRRVVLRQHGAGAGTHRRPSGAAEAAGRSAHPQAHLRPLPVRHCGRTAAVGSCMDQWHCPGALAPASSSLASSQACGRILRQATHVQRLTCVWCLPLLLLPGCKSSRSASMGGRTPRCCCTCCA